MPRFFVPPEHIHDNRFVLTGSEAHHALAVYRFREGDELELFDGKDRSFRGRIDGISESTIQGVLLQSTTADISSAANLILFAGLIKGPRWDWLVQKACEVGVDVLVPIVTERTVVDLSGKDTEGKRERWERISMEAAKQCGRVRPMAVRSPLAMKEAASAAPTGACWLIPSEKAKGTTVRQALQKAGHPSTVLLWIGPEGGWSADELHWADQQGAQAVTLGPRLLRSETAAMVASALVRDYFEGDARV